MESKKAKDYLPKNKFDQQSLCGIDELSNEEIQPIIYELLTWLQDYNWPVADKVLQVLRKREILVFPYLADILAGDDIMWKIWIMELLVPTLTAEHKEALRKNIFAFEFIKQTHINNSFFIVCSRQNTPDNIVQPLLSKQYSPRHSSTPLIKQKYSFSRLPYALL